MTKNNPKAEWADWASPPTTITVMETEKHQRQTMGFKPKH